MHLVYYMLFIIQYIQTFINKQQLAGLIMISVVSCVPRCRSGCVRTHRLRDRFSNVYYTQERKQLTTIIKIKYALPDGYIELSVCPREYYNIIVNVLMCTKTIGDHNHQTIFMLPVILCRYLYVGEGKQRTDDDYRLWSFSINILIEFNLVSFL